MPPQPPSGYIIDIQREGEGGGTGGGATEGGGGASGSGRTTRAMISRGPASLFSRFAGMDPNTPLSVALGRERESRSGGLEELVNRTTGPEFKAKLDEVRKEQAERQKKEAEEASAKEGGEASSSEKKEVDSTSSASAAPADTTTTTASVETKPSVEPPKLDTKEDEAMDTSEKSEATQLEEKPMEQDKPSDGGVTTSSGEGGASGAAEGGDKKEPGEKKEGEGGEGEDDGETPQYLARLLSELITGMVAPGMEVAPNDGT